MKRRHIDWLTTASGIVGAAVQSTQIDWPKLLSGDPHEVGKLAGALVTAILGWAIHHRTDDSTPDIQVK